MKSFFHPKQKLHHPQTYLSRGKMRIPQEIPERAEQILKGLAQLNLPVTEPIDHGMAPLLRVHDAAYLDFLQTAHAEWKTVGPDWGDEVIPNVYVREPNALRGILAKAGRYLADGSCPVGPHTWTTAYWGAQAAISGAQAILAGDKKAYALCRPPGHHTRKDAAGGFCYLNNAAIAAELLRDKYQRVVILDTDVHHGQGVQEIFYNRDDVLYVSVHGDPTNFYPVTAGFDDETGASVGVGYNLNLPMPHGSSEEVFFERVQQALKAIEAFKPDALVYCLGFDVYKDDPQTKVAVTTDGFGRLGRLVAELNLPTLVVQEGGYHLETLATNTVSFFNGFLARA
ncbi:histone deacetylase family protein [Zwartia sp.]|uniref:histone deacetylase family protein n=1 Tax=Zwartia sp. TaxID=2978004 RepID=UPI00271B0C33|nr:histone deacetylase family protein [Zwartia sp.]MDO9023538.1 histone deacetylase family protein [Zwartia sp.]